MKNLFHWRNPLVIIFGFLIFCALLVFYTVSISVMTYNHLNADYQELKKLEHLNCVVVEKHWEESYWFRVYKCDDGTTRYRP